MYTNKFQGERMVEYTKEMTQVSKKKLNPSLSFGQAAVAFYLLGVSSVCKTGADLSNTTFYFWKPLIYCTELRLNYHLKLKGQPLNLSHIM